MTYCKLMGQLHVVVSCLKERYKNDGPRWKLLVAFSFTLSDIFWMKNKLPKAKDKCLLNIYTNSDPVLKNPFQYTKFNLKDVPQRFKILINLS